MGVECEETYSLLIIVSAEVLEERLRMRMV
jgi:hypothetical protein